MKIYENESFKDLYYELESFEDIELTGCTFTDCAFTDITVYNCRFTECTFIRCSIISPKCAFTTVRLTDLKETTVRNVDWSGFKGTGFINEPVNSLKGCFLQYNRFGDMQLRKFSFSGNDMKDCLFTDCNLADALFKDTDLANTEFIRCDLSRADFRDSYGYRINVNNNNVKGARFSSPEALRLLEVFGVKVDL